MAPSEEFHQPPIHQLIDDILLLIFELRSGEQAGEWGSPPWEFSAVCQRWREVALSYPSLWAEIVFTPKDRWSLSQAESERERLEEQLKRAQSFPLSLRIDFLAVNADSPSSGMHPSFQILQQNFTRCRRLELHGALPSSYAFAASDGASPPPRFSSLQSLCICDPSWILDSYFSNTPALKRVDLDSIDLTVPTFRDVLHLDNLHQLLLSLCEFSTEALINVLRACAHNLRVLTVAFDKNLHRLPTSIIPSRSLTATPSLKVDLPELRKLVFFHAGDPSSLCHLRAPRIESFRLSGPKDTDLLAARELLRSSHSPGSLMELIIEDAALDHDSTELGDLLGEVKGLQRLLYSQILFSSSPTETLLNALRANRSRSFHISQQSQHGPSTVPGHHTASVVCPRLKELSLMHVVLNSQSLENMVRSRIRTSSGGDNRAEPDSELPVHLEEVALDGIRLTCGDLNWLEDMAQQGIVKTSGRRNWIEEED